MSNFEANTSLVYLKGVGANRAALLASELGIRKTDDLFGFFPYRYVDRTQFYKVNQLQQNTSEVQLVGKITSLKTIKQKRGSRLSATFEDATGSIELLWFRGAKWIKESIKIGEPYVVFGKTNSYKGHFSMPHPEMDLVSNYKNKIQSAMQPIYSSTEKLTNSGVSNKVFSGIVEQLFKAYYGGISETLSSEIVEKLGLISKKEALLNIHFPKSQELLSRSQYRLKFEELFFIQIQLLRNKIHRKQKIKFLKQQRNITTFPI